MFKKFSLALIPLTFIINIFLLKASKEGKRERRRVETCGNKTKKLTCIIRTIDIDIYSLV